MSHSRIFIVTLALFAAAPISAWTGPTASPPSGNVAAPVNVGSTGQVKQGDLGILGNLGVGTPSPAVKLDLTGGNLIVRSTWGSSDNVQINGNQMWNTAAGLPLILQWSNTTGAVQVGGQSGATNALNVYGGIWSRDSVTSARYCIGTSCITSWPTGVGGSGTAGKIPRFTSATALGNSSISSDGVSATATGNFFVSGYSYLAGRVGIGTVNPAVALDVNGSIKVGNGGESCQAASAGAVRYNSTSKTMEYCNATAWTALGGTDTVVRLSAIRSFTSGTNATYTAPANVSYIVVEVWGGGASGGSGVAGGTTCFGASASACSSPLLQATGGNGMNGGNGSGGDINLTGGPGGVVVYEYTRN